MTSEGLANQLKARKYSAVVIPPYDYTRIEKIKVAVVAAQAAGKSCTTATRSSPSAVRARTASWTRS